MTLHEGDKTRFLRPMYDQYNEDGTILFDELLSWVNEVGQNKYTYNWLQKDKAGLYDDIVRDYKDYKASGGSRKERKADVIGYAESKGLKFLAENDKYIFFWVPSYEAAVWCDSFDCAGFGGKWCIGWQGSDKKGDDTYWRNYTGKGDKFVLAMKKRPNNAQDAKVMIELAPINATPRIWYQTDKPGDTTPWTKWKTTLGLSYAELKLLVKRAEKGENLKEHVENWDQLLEGMARRDKSKLVELFIKD